MMDIGLQIFLSGVVFFVVGALLIAGSEKEASENPVSWMLILLASLIGGILSMVVGLLVWIWS